MTEEQKVELVGNLLTGKSYLCEKCNGHHNKIETTVYWQGIEIGIYCPNGFSVKVNDIKMADYVPVGIEVRI